MMILLLLILDSEADRALISGLFASYYHRMKGVALAILRTPDATENSFLMWNDPAFAVLSRCVPPQSSME